MYEAEVGDDVYKEDPSVNKLQDMSSKITGMEDSLLVSSGTMGNLISFLTLTNREKKLFWVINAMFMLGKALVFQYLVA
ncbi:MAG: hypothetical protein CM15mP129_09010 [Chloroflexota bacterium]|nr:MAG: hypothetical protein CM15mP129_09010 [Chloroflexota bacterium]